jgi:hypothetical protein
MKRKLFMVILMAVAVISISLLLATCAGVGGGEEDGVTGVTLTLTFKDNYSGQPIEGVTMVVNGTTHTSDSSGKISTSTEGETFPIEGYFRENDLIAIGYEGLGSTLFFKFTALSNFQRTLFLDPLSLPTAFSINGSVEDKNASPLDSGDIEIFTADGRNVGERTVTTGTYSASVYDTGNLYIFVEDWTGGDNYYTIVNITGAGTYNLSYDGTDLSFDGDASDADWLDHYLVLGEELIWWGYSTLSSPFSISLAHQGSDVIRLGCSKEDSYLPDPNFFEYISPTQHTAGASNLSLTFSTDSTVDPASWTSGLNWDSDTRTLTWNAAGNATGYLIEFEKPLGVELVTVYTDGTSLTLPADIDLTGHSSTFITPVWSNGYSHQMSDLFPASMIAETFISYENLEYNIP